MKVKWDTGAGYSHFCRIVESPHLLEHKELESAKAEALSLVRDWLKKHLELLEGERKKRRARRED